MLTLHPRARDTVDFQIARSKEHVHEILRSVIDERHKERVVDHRRTRRYPLCEPVEIIPYDAKGNRTGAPFTAVSKDVSAGGMAFLHNSAIRDRIVAISFPQSERYCEERLIMEVTRRRAVGPLWEIAGEFLTDATRQASKG